MANYKQTTETTTSYRRSNFIGIDNPANGIPTMCFKEEQITTLTSGETFKKEVDQLLVEFNPTANIILLDPITSIPTSNTITHTDLYQILYSVYMAAAIKRDIDSAA
jgi:hypothetical protein